MELFGKPPINPLLFYPGKIAGYIVWIGFVYALSRDNLFACNGFFYKNLIAYCLFALGVIISIVSLLHLGKSVRFGLPTYRTELKTSGIYRFSRNPMYVSFGLFTIASIIYTLNVILIVLGIFSLVVYHLIIKSEENFLQSQFGNDYEQYRKKVRRYL